MRSQITTDIGAMVDLVKKVKDIPCAVGFGISNPEQAKKMAGQSDGVIVGSAIVKLCGQYGVECVPYVKEYVKAMKDAVRRLRFSCSFLLRRTKWSGGREGLDVSVSFTVLMPAFFD